MKDKYPFPKPRPERDDTERPRWPIPHPDSYISDMPGPYINNPRKKPSEML